MTDFKKAFVISGRDEDHHSVEGLAHEISEGAFRVVDDAEPLTFTQAIENKERVARESKNRLVVTHGRGIMAVRHAGVIVALNGIEPTPLKETFANARHALHPEPIVDEPTEASLLKYAVHELAHHPGVALRVLGFSTLKRMIDHKGDFPGGRIYLPTEQDEFRFGHHGEIERAQRADIIAHMLPGYHNQQLLRPAEGAEHIADALNELDQNWL